MQTSGENAILIANNLLNLLSKDDEIETKVLNPQLYNIINNPHRLNRILREYDAIWPDNKSKIKVSLQFGKTPHVFLDPVRKNLIRSLIQKAPEVYEKEVDGRLIELRVDKRREFQIDSPEGLITCQYAPEIEYSIINLIGGLVRIRGLMKPQGGKYVLNIQDELSLIPLNNLDITSFRVGSIEKHLKEPIPIDISFEDDQYIVSNDVFGLLVVAPSLEKATKEIQEELSDLWNDYVNCPDEELTNGAKRFKAKLKGLVDDCL